MLGFSYHMPVKILWGRDIIQKEASVIKNFGNKVAILTGATSAAKSGALSDVVNICNKNGHLFQIFSGVENDPSVENVLKLALEIDTFRPDFLIAIGGGSVIDAAKVIAILLANGLEEEVIWLEPVVPPLPLIVVPTTSGTGSEVTPYAVLTDNQKETKRSVSHEAIYPKVAYLDPKYTESLPYDTTINTAIDALSHLLEGFLANRANNMSDIYAIKGMQLISETKFWYGNQEINEKDRQLLMGASLFGGLTIAKSGTTLVHALGYSLTYFHGIPHGKANGLLLGAYLDYVGKVIPDKTSIVLETLGFSKPSEFNAFLKRLYPDKLNLSTREIALYVEKALKTNNILNTKGEVSGFVLADILERSLN